MEVLFEVLLQGVCYLTGRVIVPLFSYGRVRVVPAPKGVSVRPRWHGLHRAADGRRYMDADMATLVGVLFWIVAAIVGVGAYALFR